MLERSNIVMSNVVAFPKNKSQKDNPKKCHKEKNILGNEKLLFKKSLLFIRKVIFLFWRHFEMFACIFLCFRFVQLAFI